MRFKIPGQSIHVRIFEPVKTVEDNYHIYDTGLDYGNGDIDSLAVGGSFATVSNWVESTDDKAEKKAEKKAAKKARKARKEAVKRAEAEAAVNDALQDEPVAA